MITPVFAALPPRSVDRQPRQAQPGIPLPAPQPGVNPVENNAEAIPAILNDSLRIMHQRRAQNQNAVRFGMDAHPPEGPNPPGLPGQEEDDPPGTPPDQGIPQVVPNAPQVNRVIPRAAAPRGEALVPQAFRNLLPQFNVAAPPQPQQPPQSPSVQSTQTRVEMPSPTKSVNDSSQ
ncbi:hypothetical protein [Vampirovibrio chlorellavorus]|uniref:hypothetical protein n=1 Tax=Vampirovibrio chlorellavorus TaxID=758823 RepID=UPI0026EE58AA|nr:hypothetical protein [Vampirovibrio chlorellavorus]